MMLDQFKLFDAHLHIIDERFPLFPNQGYLPENFTCDDYLQRLAAYDLAGGAVVSGSFQQFDTSYLIDALDKLGENFVGVINAPATISDNELIALHQAGVRALRFNLKRGGSEECQHLESMAKRVHELTAWHVEMYVDVANLDDLYHTILRLPAVSIDHLGLSKAGLPTLLKLIEKDIKVKATGFSRVNFNVATVLRDIYIANPNALMFGTDLPSTRAPKPYHDKDFLCVIESLGDAAANAVFYENARVFYQK